jgi:photosystem II stability/assembly factor-like uncharacterized protein
LHSINFKILFIMKKLLLLCAISFAFSANAQDFWTEVSTSQPTATTGTRSISFVDANIIWLNNNCGTANCTSIRRYSKSLDGGLTWTTAPINLGPSSANLEISNIHAVSAIEAYAAVFATAGATGGIWKTIDGGTVWNRQSSASYNFATSFPNLVYFWPGTQQGVTMGDPNDNGFEVYVTTNGGTNWSPAAGLPDTLGSDEYGYTNQFTTFGDNIWIGTAYGRLLKSSDKGATWNIYQTPIPDFGGQVNGTESADMAFTSANNGLITTSDYGCYSTSDGGVTWTPVTYTGTLRSFSVTAITGLPNAYVTLGKEIETDTGANTDPRGSSYTIDGGVTWVNINDTPDTNYVDGSASAFFSPTLGLAGGFNTNPTLGGIFRWNGVALQNAILATNTFSNDIAFKASPNPTTGLVALTGKNIANVIITDVLGKQVSNTNYTSLNNVNLDLTAANSGMYMVKVTNNEGNVSTLKVVKQ